jgi:hypothetical protein
MRCQLLQHEPAGSRRGIQASVPVELDDSSGFRPALSNAAHFWRTPEIRESPDRIDALVAGEQGTPKLTVGSTIQMSVTPQAVGPIAVQKVEVTFESFVIGRACQPIGRLKEVAARDLEFVLPGYER